MSTEKAPQPAPNAVKPSHPHEIKIISHSPLLYWWPVWAIGFIMGLVSWQFGLGNRMVVVPGHTMLAEVKGDATVQIGDIPETVKSGNQILIPPIVNKEDGKRSPLNSPGVTVSNSKTPGVLFCTALLLVITITNIPLRGLWSIIVIVVVISLVVILALAGAWEWILDRLSILDIRISTGGYFLISGILFIIWSVVFFFFDSQIYMVFTPGSFRVRLEIGEGEKAYDTRGMTYEKVRSDIFRHWILGLGSGDLIIRTSGAQAHQFDLHNVLFLNRKVKIIEEMLRTQVVASSNS